MIQITIPGLQTLSIEHLVMDYNGTLARDGILLDGVRERLLNLSETIRLHVITADTFGLAKQQLVDTPCEMAILPGEHHSQAKLNYVKSLGPSKIVAIGNGRNDQLMLKEVALGIVVVQGEGAAIQTCLAADVIVTDILIGLDLLLHPKRMTATLRS